MPVIDGSRYDRPEVQVVGMIGFDGVTRKYLTPRTPLTRDQFVTGRIRIKRQGDELDQIAFVEYRDSRLWYIIAEVNNVQDAAAIPNNTPLFIPASSEVAALTRA